MDMYKKILSGKISWPGTFSKTIKSLISKLVHKDHTKRITAIRIQKHKYFAGVDWVSVFRRDCSRVCSASQRCLGHEPF